MPRWICSVVAAASWPVASLVGIVLISPPVLALYDAGLLGTAPAGAMTFITVAAFALSTALSVAIYTVLHAYCDYDEERESRREARAE